ncbi:MAG: hypothetical protein ACR2NP_17110 [Pirellulaceae bacterium]
MANRLMLYSRANPVVGMNRLLRSLILAREWQRRDGEVELVSGQLPALLRRKIAISGCQLHLAESRDKQQLAKQLLQMAGQLDCPWIAVDDTSPELVEFLGEKKKSPQRLLVIGEAPPNSHTDFETGAEPAFALIRKNLQKRPSPTHKRKLPHRCLIDLSCLNGSESAGMINRLCRPTGKLCATLDIISPFAASAVEQMNRQSPALRKRIFWHRNSDRLFASLHAFDLAVTTDAASFFEAAWCRVASVLLAQRKPARAKDTDSLTTRPWIIDRTSDDWVENSCQHILGFLKQPDSIDQHAQEMKRLVDTQGAMRICEFLQNGAIKESRRARSA